MPKCRLYLQLLLPLASKLESQLTQALAGSDIACVLLCPDGGRAGAILANKLIDLVHEAGTACLIEANAPLAERLDADGVHIAADPQTYKEARNLLGQEASIGVACGFDRHEAMRLAEMGADYVAFGGGDASADRCAELIAWWAEIFVVPCVAWDIDDPEEAARLARLGADFVAPSKEIWQDGAAWARISEIGHAIAQVRRAA